MIGDTLGWAKTNIDKFSFWSSKQDFLHANLPNVFTLPPLLNSISDAAKHWGSDVDGIVHDQQSQFESTLREWHAAFAGLDQEEIFHFGDTPIRFADIHGSRFEMRDSKFSPGLQVVDVVLWVCARSLSDKRVGRLSNDLFELCFSPEDVHIVSLGTIAEELEFKSALLMAQPLSEEQILSATATLDRFERDRKRKTVVVE